MWDTSTSILYFLACMPAEHVRKNKQRYIDRYLGRISGQMDREAFFVLVGKINEVAVSESAQCRIQELRRVVDAERRRGRRLAQKYAADG